MIINRLVDWAGITYYLNMEFHVRGGENYKVDKIIENIPTFKKEMRSYDVVFSNKTFYRFFEVKEIEYKEDNKK